MCIIVCSTINKCQIQWKFQNCTCIIFSPFEASNDSPHTRLKTREETIFKGHTSKDNQKLIMTKLLRIPKNRHFELTMFYISFDLL